MKEVKILGAGIAGLTAAINLSDMGYDVSVFDRRKENESRFGGDLQGLENWSSKEDVKELLKRVGVKVNFHFAPYSNVTFSNGEKSVELSLDRPMFYMVKRGAVEGSLDNGLLKQAKEKNVRLYFEKALPKNEANIVATGTDTGKIFAIAKGMVFKTNSSDIAIALVNDKAAYKGYAYLLITGGYGCICTVFFDRFSDANEGLKESERVFKKLTKFDMRDIKPVGGVGSFGLQTSKFDDGAIAVGETAGIHDLLAGFGMRTAMRSGFLAARCISEGLDYRKESEREFDNYLRAGVVNRFLWEKLRFGNYSFLLNKISGARDVFGFLEKNYNFSTMQKIIYPIAATSIRGRYPNLEI